MILLWNNYGWGWFSNTIVASTFSKGCPVRKRSSSSPTYLFTEWILNYGLLLCFCYHYSHAQVVSDLANVSPFVLAPAYSWLTSTVRWALPVHWPDPGVPGSSWASLSQLCGQSCLQGTLVSFHGSWYLETEIWALDVLIVVAITENIEICLSTYCHFRILFLLFYWKDSMKILKKSHPLPTSLCQIWFYLNIPSVLHGNEIYIYMQPYGSSLCPPFFYFHQVLNISLCCYKGPSLFP